MSDFALPGGKDDTYDPSIDFAIPGAGESGYDPATDFAIPEAKAPMVMDPTGDFAIPEVSEAIQSSPDPEWTAGVFQKASALNQLFKETWPEAVNRARVLQDSTDPQVKTLGKAITDRWKAEFISVQMGQLGARMMMDPANFDKYMQQYKELEAQLPALEDTLPAYPQDAIRQVTPEEVADVPKWAGPSAGAGAYTPTSGRPVTLGREAVTGAVGLAAQQVAMVASPVKAAELLEARKKGVWNYLGAVAKYAPSTIPGVSTAEVESGNAFVDMVSKGMDPDRARPYAIGIGAINGIIEAGEVATYLSMFTGAGSIVSKAIENLTKDTLVGDLLASKAGQLGAEYVTKTGSELLQEYAQEAVTFYGENLAIYAQNAAKGTALEKNTEFFKRLGELTKEFLPGLMLWGGVPIAFRAVKPNAKPIVDAKAAKPEASPVVSPVQAAAEAVKAAVKPEQAVAVVEQAVTAHAETIAKAEKLTPQMINDAVELVQMQEAVAKEAQPEAAAEETAAPAPDEMGEAVPAEPTPIEMETAALVTAEQARTAIEKGEWVDDASVGQFAGEPWAREELDDRAALRDLAAYLADSGQAGTLDGFIAEVQDVETTERSEDYYREIWDSSPKAEVQVDEEGNSDADAQIEVVAAAEEKAEKKATALDKDIEALPDKTVTARSVIEAHKAEKAQRKAAEAEDAKRAKDFERVEADLQSDEAAFVAEDPRVVKLNIEIEDLQKQMAEALQKQGEKAAAKVAELERKLADTKKLVVDVAKEVRRQGKDKLDLYKTEVRQKKESAALLAKHKATVNKTIRYIMRKPSAGMGWNAIQKLRDLQAPYTVKETKGLEGMKKAIRDYQAAHPGEALLPEAQDILNTLTIKDLTLSELGDLYKTAKEIREEGVRERKEFLAKRDARRNKLFSDMATDMPGLVVAERLHELADEKTQKKARRLARKNWIAMNATDAIRIFEDMGPNIKEHFWNRKVAADGKAILVRRARGKRIADLRKQYNVHPLEAMKEVPNEPGRWIDDTMTYYGQMKDPDGRKAVLYGNDEKEDVVSRVIANLPEKFKGFVDAIQDENGKTYGDMSQVQLNVEGRVAPEVRHYLGLRRQRDFGMEMSRQLAVDAQIRAGARVAGPANGMTKERAHYKEGTEQPRIRTDFFNLLNESVVRESEYIAKAELASDWKWLLGGQSKESKKFRAAFTQRYGKPAMDFLDDYATAVMNPDSFKGQDANGLISRISRNLSNTALIWKLGTMMVQGEGPFRALASLDFDQYQYAMAGLWKALTKLNETAEAVYQKSPAMQGMAEEDAIDPALKEGLRYRHSKTAFGRMMQAVNVANQEWGFKGLTQANKITVISEWMTVYMANYKELGEAKAIALANDSVYKHQPSGKMENAPRMYWLAQRNFVSRFLVRFTRATQKLAQMLVHDLPKDIKQGKIGRATGILLVIAIGGTLSAIRKYHRLPKNPEEWKQAAAETGIDIADSALFNIPSAIQKGWTGKGNVTEIKPLDAAVQAASVARDLRNGEINQDQLWHLISLIGQMADVPTPAAENVARSARDFEGGRFRIDPLELLGRKARE